MSGRAVYLVVCLVLRLPDPLPRAWSAASLRASGVAYISIIFVVRIIGASIVNYFLVGIAEFLFLVYSRDLNA
jgi:hypothetical protein